MEEFRIVLADACKIVKESSRKRVISGADEDGRVMVEFSEPVGGRRVKMLTPDEINGMLYKEETSESPANAEEAMAEETEPPTAGQEESGESALERIPKDAQTGEPQYTQTDAPTAWDAIVEQTEGDEDMARSVVDSTVRDKEAALKKLESSNPKPGATVAEKIAAAKEHKAAIEAARQELEQWKAIAEVENRRKAEVEAKVKAAEEEAKAKAKAKAEEEEKTDESAERYPVGLDEEESSALMERMEAEAAEIPLIELNPANWVKEFGEKGIVSTPIGEVKMGENQIAKLFEKGRSNQFGMIRPTLETPQLIIEVPSFAADGNSERGSSLLFVKTFTDSKGRKIYYFKSVTVKKDGLEVSVSSHYDRPKRIKEALKKGKLLYRFDGGAQTEQRPADVSVATSREVSQGISLAGKVSESPETKQEKAEKSISARVKEASAEVNTAPTEAQKEAGNYKKGHVQVGAFDITIEQPEGSIRRGTDADGKQWESKMHNTYGYFRGTEGVDGDHIDVFLSNDIDGWNGRKVYVVDQYNPDGSFDEHKVMLGFNDASDAKNNYLSNYEKGWENGRRIDVSAVNLEDFEKWIASSHRKTKPFSEYKSVKPADGSETFKGHKVENSGKDTEAQIKHLEEIKDYPGADKKIVQSEIDRLKAKEEAKAKSKSEEKNGVDDAKIEAVSEALSKGDEKAEQLVQGLTSRELSKLRSKVKASPVLENEWLHRVRTRGDVSLHDWMLENQYVEPVKRVSGTFKMTDYIAPKDSPYAERIGGVYHDKSGFAVATDGRILVADKGSYDPKLKGKIIGKDGVAMENKFPDWQEAISTAKETKSSLIDVEGLHRFVAGVLRANKRAYISLRFPDGTVGVFKANRLNLMLRAMKQLGTSELLYTKDGMILVAKSEKGTAMLMGLVSVEDELVEANGYAYPGNTVSYHRGEVVSEMSQEERVLRDAVIDRLRESGMEVITDEEAGQRVLDEANGKAKLSAKKRRALETASLGKTPRSLTVVSSADGAKVLKSIDTLVSEFEKSAVQPKTFIGDVAKALGAKRGGSASEYASFETKNGKIITIRLSNHNAKVSNFDANGETDGISIVVSPKKSEGMTNDGKAHVVEYYYDAIKLRRAEGKPLADIVRSIKQALYSGEFEDTTGLAERQEVNAEITDRVRFFRTAKGEAYGFTVGGKIYIDPKIANTETSIHEYAHLWAAALRGQNPKEWQNIVELMKGTSVWDEVKKRYPELNTDDDIADEVLATYSGRRGAERLREEQRKIAGDKGGVFEKAEAISALERVKQALRKFWKSVADFLHIHYKSAEEVADRVMKDLLDGVDPRKHFNSHNDDPRFMFAGEKGAARADRGEEALTRQNNLDAAQKMEAAKKEAKAIKLATGWERGADGKWRYEILDGIYHSKGDAELKKALAKQPWREELNGLSDRILDGEGLSKEETERFNELAEKEAAFKADYLKKEKPHLADWLENDELFKAYPELKRVGIVFTDNMPKEQAGYYDSKSNTITVNTNSSEDTASIIAHEVQHAIQRYEGFATGGNLKAAMEYLSGNKRADVKIKQQLAYKLSQEKGLGLSEEEVNSLIGHLEYEDISDDELQKQIDALCQKHNITEDQLEDIYPMDSVWHEAYNRISGEAEARNVQKRMGMTAEERRASLAADTEDVARADQILLFADTGESMSLESPKEERIEKLRESKPVEITGEEITPSDDLKQYKRNALEYGKKLRGVYTNEDTGEQIELTGGNRRGGLREILQHDYKDKEHLQSIAAIPQIIEKAIFIDELPNEDRKNYPGVRAFRYYVCGLKIADVDYTVKAVIAEQNNGERYYDHKLTKIEKGKLLSIIPTIQKAGMDSDLPRSVGKDSRLLSILQVKDEKKPNDGLYRVGGGKELRDGRKIEFVRKPTATYNALARHLQAEGIKPDMHEARTGSRYMSFEKDGVQWEVRSSDHTKPEYYGEAQKPVELTYYKDKQGEENLSVSVDLGTSGYNIEDMKALLAEIDRLKNDAGEVKESFDRGVASDEVVERYPLLSQALGVKSENEVRAKEEAREHAEEARKQEMRSAVEDMAGKLHLNNVDIVDKPAERGAGRRERAKGMFERSTGRITINIGNCADKRDAVVTLLHEAVAHHGLRKLFGENFETFLDNVYNSANAEIRRIIDKHSSRYGGDKRTATEEYMASLAERTDFENAKKSGWWQRIKDFFLKMLEKIGLKGFKGEDLSDNELRYVLWRSYENLKSGSKDTVFSAANDLAKQSDDKTKFRLLEDDDPKAIELESLPDSELVPVYRNAQAFEDDALGSPMAFTDAETGERRTLQGGKWNYSNPPQIELTPEQQRQLDELNKNGYIVVDDKKTTELQINDGLKFVKPKTKDAQLQYFLKKNPEDKGLWAAYDPYDHAIETPLNTQFAGAYNRPNLVVVRSLIPKSEIDEPFHADYALLPTGAHQWNNGRTLYLSRWSKIDKVLTREEEAKMIDEYWKKHPGKREALKSHRDYNRFVPQVRRELEKMGYRFELDGKELTPEESRALDEQNWESRDVIPGREGHTPFVSNEDIARINAKMSGKWVGEPKEAMENAMTARVNELAERLHTPVRIVRTDEEVAALPSARQRRMKGSFNPMTGEVTIVVPNNANMADVENTFIHEVVGHDGLRVLFPEEEKLNNALDELYRVSKDEIRNSIDRMAQKMYDAEVDRLREKKRKEHEANGEDSNASYYADMAEAHAEASKKREQFKRDATEEYGADLAGRIGEKGFEKMSAEELTFWGKLKSMLQNALRKLAEGLGIPGVRKWGDNEWAFVLHEAYKRKRNGGRPSVADAADTVSARESTGFDGGLYRVGDFVRQREQEGNLEEVNRRFNGRLDELTEENADEVRLELGMPNRILKASGIPGKPMVLYGNKIIKKANKHGFAPTDIKNLPKVLQSPIAVFEGSHKDSFAILTEMSIGGKNVLVSIETNKKGELDFNIISSVFGKNNKGVIDWVNKGKLLYADKEKALRYISASAHIADATYKAELDTAANVVRNFENPKVSGGKVSGEDLMFRDGDAKDYEKAQARDRYERRVSTGMFQSREAIQDSMLSLKVAMDAIEEATAGKAKRIEDYDGFENAYLGENRLSSVNQAESAAFAHLLIRPMMEEVNRLAPTAEDRAELIDYMFAKHGLERNAYMRQQAAEKKLAEYKKQNPGTAKTAADFIDAERDYAGLTTLTGEADVSAAEAEAQRMEADYENDYTFHGTWNEIYVCRKKIC